MIAFSRWVGRCSGGTVSPVHRQWWQAVVPLHVLMWHHETHVLPRNGHMTCRARTFHPLLLQMDDRIQRREAALARKRAEESVDASRTAYETAEELKLEEEQRTAAKIVGDAAGAFD